MEEEQKAQNQENRSLETHYDMPLSFPCLSCHDDEAENHSILPNLLGRPIPRLDIIEYSRHDENEFARIFKETFRKYDYPEKVHYCPLNSNTKPLPHGIFEKYYSGRTKPSTIFC